MDSNHSSEDSIQAQQKRLTYDTVLDVDSSSTKSGRRPSVDTVSTYLSHETPIDLLDNSLGSDEIYKDSVVGKFFIKNSIAKISSLDIFNTIFAHKNQKPQMLKVLSQNLNFIQKRFV